MEYTFLELQNINLNYLLTIEPENEKKNAEKRCHIFGEMKSLNFTQHTKSQDVGSHLKTQMIQYITGQ